MSATLTYTWPKELERRLDRLAQKVTDLGPLRDKIGMMLVGSTQHRFEQGCGPDGTPWEPSARSRAEGGQPLTDSGVFGDSITYLTSGDDIRVGTNKVQGAIHQFGGIIKAKNAKALFFQVGGGWVFVKKVEVPARPYLGISVEDEQAIKEIVDEFIVGALR